MSVERVMVNGHELTAFDLAPEPSETYTVNVDGLGEIVVERGKPPKEEDVPAMYMRKLVPELCKQNAELRELVREMWRELDASTQYDAGGGRGAVSEFADRMRELGIEVER